MHGSHRLHRSMPGSMFSRTFGRHEIVGGVDQRDVGKSLRKISELPAKHGIVFLGKQANVVAQTEQTLKQTARLRRAAGHRVVVGEPERTRQERTLARRQSIDASLSRGSEHPSFVHK